jgi:lipopolysaccharide transport system permease protein
VLEPFRTLAAQRELLFSLVKRDLKVRYKDSTLGFFWSLGRPLILMIILSVVFSFLGRFEIPGGAPYPLFLIAGLLPWMFLAGAAAESTHLLLGNAPLIKKVSLNAAVFPAACVLSNLIHFALAAAAYAGFLLWHGRGIGWALWVAIPAAAIQTLLCLAIALLCGALNVFYRDTASIVELATMGMFYLTPILYPISEAFQEIDQRLPEGQAQLAKTLYMLNPMAPLVALYRRAFLFHSPDLELPDAELALWTLTSAATTLALLTLGWRVFNYYRPRFADRL